MSPRFTLRFILDALRLAFSRKEYRLDRTPKDLDGRRIR